MYFLSSTSKSPEFKAFVCMKNFPYVGLSWAAGAHAMQTAGKSPMAGKCAFNWWFLSYLAHTQTKVEKSWTGSFNTK